MEPYITLHKRVDAVWLGGRLHTGAFEGVTLSLGHHSTAQMPGIALECRGMRTLAGERLCNQGEQVFR